jgi:hypothetical protein
MEQAEVAASPRLRMIFAGFAVSMLVLWGSSLSAVVENWGNPNEDGLSYVPAFWASVTCLPVGLYLFAGAVVGRGRPVARARRALLLALILLLLVIAFVVFQHAADGG